MVSAHRERIKALAAEHHVSVISTVGGKLVVEPIDIARTAMTPLRRSGGRYLSEKRKLQLPLRHFAAEDDAQLMEGIYEFLRGLLDYRQVT